MKTLEYSEVTPDISYTTLNSGDVQSFIMKVNHNLKRYYFKNSYYQHDIINISNANIYPVWFKVADTIRINNIGTYSIFSTSNPHLDGGWGGYKYNETIEYGKFYSYPRGSRLGYGYYLSEHTDRYWTTYYEKNNSFIQLGFLTKFSYHYISDKEINSMVSAGFTYTQNDGVIVLSNEEYHFTWDTKNHIFIKTYYSIPGVWTYTIKSTYEFNTLFNVWLLSTTKTTRPKTFTNGDCAVSVSEEIYTNYSVGCNGFETRERLNDEALGKFECTPNPTEDLITFSFDSQVESEKLYSITIYDIEGRMVKNYLPNSNFVKQDVGDLARGYYVVKALTSMGNSLNSKFIKL